MKNNEILAIHGTDYKEMTKQLLNETALHERIPDKECRIGIKPNLVAPSDPSWGATTHPEVVAGIIEYLQERDFQNLVMLEGSWVGIKQQRQQNFVDIMSFPTNMAWNFLICRKIPTRPMTVKV